jgi:NitT/TauT family transport system permease protein
MTFSFYQSLRTTPRDLDEVARGFHLTAVAALLAARSAVRDARPDLEHDDVDVGRLVLRGRLRGDHGRRHHDHAAGHRRVSAQAIDAQSNLGAIGWVILAMTVVILAYDQLLFRPLVAWADKFRMERPRPGKCPESWVLDLFAAHAPDSPLARAGRLAERQDRGCRSLACGRLPKFPAG